MRIATWRGLGYTAFMFFWLYTIILTFSAFLCAWAGCHAARYVLHSMKVVDTPNERSNHSLPTPRGGGIAVMVAVLGFLTVAGVSATIIITAMGLTVLSFLDDQGGLDVRPRLLVQVLAVALLFLPQGVADHLLAGPVFQGLLPPLYDRLLSALLLLGFMNIFNFMDGIDGITGVETLAIGGGMFMLSLLAPSLKMAGIDGIIIAAAAAGFLLLNWHPAKLFLGDAGSIPLGFLLGFLLLQLAASGFWVAALLLPGYYLMDGGLTLLRRLLKREKIWQAHSQHAYQKAVRGGLSHATVSKRIALLNLLLLALAALSVLKPELNLLILGAGGLAILLLWLKLQRRRTRARGHALSA